MSSKLIDLKAKLLPVGSTFLHPGAFPRKYYIARLKATHLPCSHSIEELNRKQPKRRKWKALKRRFLPCSLARTAEKFNLFDDLRGLADSASDSESVSSYSSYSSSGSTQRKKSPPQLHDPVHSMRQVREGSWGADVHKIHISTHVEHAEGGSVITPKFKYNGKEAEELRKKRMSKSGDAALDEILDMSFDEILSRDYPDGITINDIDPKPQVEEVSSKEYQWFDADDDDDDIYDVNEAIPLINRKVEKLPPGWEDIEEADDLLNDNDSDIDKFFDTDGGGHALRMGNSYRPDSEETRPDGGGGDDDERNNSLKNRSLAGDEDIILSDHFTLKFTDPTVPSQAERSHMKSPVQQVSRQSGSPVPQVAKMSTPWSGTVTTAVMPTTQGMWVFVPQPPASEPGRRRDRPQQFHADGSPIRNLKVTRSWNLGERAKTTSYDRRGQYFHYRNKQHTPEFRSTMGSNLSTNPRRRLFTMNQGQDRNQQVSSNPYNRIRELKDMIASLESSIDSLQGKRNASGNEIDAPM